MSSLRHVDLDRVLKDVRSARATEEHAEPRSIEWLRARYRVLAGEEVLNQGLGDLQLEDIERLARAKTDLT